ncbi:MAG: ACT domain-containing protein [Firmicutes bacterium]|nr:ACT domain-containing protein [Bacillota bacterium]
MFIKQVSVFLENTKGRLAEITRLLADNNVDLKAMSIAETADFGILRVIVEDPENAVAILKGKGFIASITDVVAVELNDRPGGFADVLEILAKEGINVNYVYSTIHSKKDTAMIVLKVEEPGKVIDILGANGVKLYKATEL